MSDQVSEADVIREFVDEYSVVYRKASAQMIDELREFSAAYIKKRADENTKWRVGYTMIHPLTVEYDGHTYAGGDEVEFLHRERWIRTTLRFDRDGLRSSHPWRDDVDYKPFILTTAGSLCIGVDGLRPYEPENLP